MKKKYSISIICVFLAVIVFFTSFSVFGKKSDFSVDENRALMTMPDFELDSLLDGSFQKDYEEYLSDQFEWRSFFVTVKTNIMRTLGRQDLNGVYFGKDGYLIEKYTPSDFDSENVEYNEEMLACFLGYCTDRKIKTVCAFVPSKASVLKNELPKNVIPYDTSYVLEDMKYTYDAGARIIDLSITLSSQGGADYYYKTDHHWTSNGAYRAYQFLSEPLGYKPIPADALKSKVVSEDFYGSTYDKVHSNVSPDKIISYDDGEKVIVDYNGEENNSDSLYNPEMLGEKNKYDYFLGGNYARVDITTGVKNGKTLFLIKDSYANSMVPFLCRNYSKIVMLDLRYFSDDVYNVLEEVKPDSVLVLFNTEKFMIDQNMDLLEQYEDEE